MDGNYRALVDSNRVSPQTRKALTDRESAADPDYRSAIFSENQFKTLRALGQRIIPQDLSSEGREIDLSARLDKQLATGKGDGWRYADLPPDVLAYVTGLNVLDEFAHKLNQDSFDNLSSGAQDDLLTAIATGRVSTDTFDMKRWFEDVRATITGIYVSHPDTLSSMHYGGIADDPRGFVQIGIGKVEPWEPQSK